MADATDIPFEDLPEWAKPTWARTAPATITAPPVSSSGTLVNPPSRGLTGTQLGSKVSEGAADAWKSLTTKPEWLTDAERPLQQTPQQRLVSNAKQMQLAGAVTPPEVENENAVIPRTTPEKVVAGGIQAIGDLADSFQTPLGAATLGIGGLPRIAQKAVAGAFSAYMAKQTPEIAKQLGDEFGKNADQRDPQKIAKLVADAGLNTAFSVAGALHAAGMEAPPASPKETISATPMVPAESPPNPSLPIDQKSAPPETATGNQFPLGKGAVDISVPQKSEAPVAQPQTTVLPESGKIEQPAAPASLPPTPKGEQVVTVQRADGTTYPASYGGKFYDMQGIAPNRYSIGRIKNGGWSHGTLEPGETILNDPFKKPSEPAPPSSPPPTIAKPPAAAPTAGGASPAAPKPNIRQQAKSFTDLVKEHADTQKWAQGQTLDDLHTPHPGKTNLGTMGIKGAMAIEKAIKVALRNAAKDLGLDPDQIGKESYRAKHLDKLQAFIAKQQPQNLPQLRPGEKGTGDLLQSEQPFNLAGEKGVDTERAAREQRARLAEARANEQFQAQHQQQFIPQGPGVKTYAASTRPDEPPETYEGTALKNAVANFERAIHGYPDAPPTEKRDMAIQFENARETLYQDHNAGSRLADRLIANPAMGLTDEQSAVLLHHKVDTENAINAAAEKTWTSKTPDDKIAAQLEYARLNEHFKELLDAVRERGSHWGREGRWRQALAFEDYSFVSREARFRAANGGRELTDAERETLHKTINDLRAEVEREKQLREASETAHREDAARQVVEAISKQPDKGAPVEPHIKIIADRISVYFDKRGKDAQKFLSGKTFTYTAALPKLIDLGVSTYLKGAADFVSWSASMLSKLDKSIQPHLEDLFERTKKALDDHIESQYETKGKPETATKVKQAVKPKDIAGQTADVTGKIEAALKKGTLEEVTPLVQKLAKLVVAKGAIGWRDVTNQVHAILKEFVPDLDYRDTMDAISGHGKFTTPKKDAVSVQLRDAKSQINEIRKIQEVIAKQPVKPTGFIRDLPSNAKRRLTQIYEEMKRRFGVNVANPEVQLRSALQARKTYYEHRITDLKHEIDRKQRTVKTKSPSPTDPALDALKAGYQKVKAEHDQIFGNRQMTDAQKLKMAMAAVERNAAEYDRRLKAGDFSRSSASKITETPELKAARARRDALREQFQEMRDLDTHFQAEEAAKDLERQKASLEQQIKDKTEKLASGDVATAPKAINRPLKPELEGLKQQVEALNKQIQEARRPQKTPEERALQAYKTRTAKRIADMEDRLSKDDFGPRPKKVPTKLDREAQEAQAKVERLKQKIDAGERNAMLKNRPTYQKVLDFFTKFLRREFVLSSPVPIGKLTMAALHGLTLEPIKEAVGAGVAKALPGFASRLKTEAPSSVKIEAKAIASAFTNTARDAAQTIRTGKSDLEMRYGGRKAVPEEMVSYFGRLHAALKTPLKRAAFERIYAKLAEQELRSGNDAHDVLVDIRIGNLAMKEANRMLYLEDNKLVSGYQRFLSAFEQKDPSTGKPSPTGTIAAGALRWTLPIVRIPTNMIARTIQSAVGLEVGIGKLAYAYAKGIQELPQEHADLIMRQLKGGSIGTAFLLYGYFNAAQFGGFYQPGEKRKEGELKPAQMSIGGVVIPAWAMHRQEFLAMQLGATIYKVAHSKIRKADTDNAGIGDGAMAGILGLTSETPMVNETLETSRMFNKYERDQYLDQQAANFVNPQFVQWVARQLDKQTPFSPTQDTTQRKATNLKEAFEMGIPGMRQNVPPK